MHTTSNKAENKTTIKGFHAGSYKKCVYVNASCHINCQVAMIVRAEYKNSLHIIVIILRQKTRLFIFFQLQIAISFIHNIPKPNWCSPKLPTLLCHHSYYYAYSSFARMCSDMFLENSFSSTIKVNKKYSTMRKCKMNYKIKIKKIFINLNP